ncbi:hypothetical protein MATR_25800 [Marivirga tractuosa]|uniref:DUF547 domain-containing protein n=1 Tax=Marivirga tractuosa (strain ATCC 23168 / DSM 4126 / NBRC 15989 / NCIMB 1408 / VKM B-1430 / H-43) TaxID=643867 RepID=E4TP32_MARTH|nr:DUF547 domain-containing protein [Marivirga tractuosa]ADR23566.1 protein of unknown function DUF547 [Marivirga tractuosa DSM 4126]BDD15755.1 hypothetical protein MATR_25800 [Marivirga tractuosa]
MKNLRLTIVIILLSSLSLMAYKQEIKKFNQEADIFLKKYVQDGKVDYKRLKDNFQEVDKLYQSLASVNIDELSDKEIKALYINAYNIIVIRQITEYYPLKSALDKNGFFDKVKHNVGGEMLTLDQIEKGKVIIPFRDPRVHFAFSCAAIGCPELADFAFTADKLDTQLDERTSNAINNPDFIKVKSAENLVELSMIFKWYEKDFKMKADDVMTYINQYRENKIPSGYNIDHYAYDWSLNIQ